MNRTTIAILAFLSSCGPVAAQQTQKFIVCPQNLSYCYKEEKPILPRLRVDDGIAAIEAQMLQLRAQREYDARRSDRGLAIELMFR